MSPIVARAALERQHSKAALTPPELGWPPERPAKSGQLPASRLIVSAAEAAPAGSPAGRQVDHLRH